MTPQESQDVLEAGGARRWVFLSVWVIQCGAAVALIKSDQWSQRFVAAVVIIGAFGLVGPKGWPLRLALGTSLLGVVLPYFLSSLGQETGEEIYLVPVLGEFNALHVGMIWNMRLLAELPIWGLYGFLVTRQWLTNRRIRSGRAAENPLVA